MPIREGTCCNDRCRLRRVKQEHYYHNNRQPLNPCESCGWPTVLVQISRTHVVFTGVITERYKDHTKEAGFGDGHMVYERDPATRKVTPRFIETFDDQRRYCKENGLSNPAEYGNSFEVAEDGKTVKNGMGMPGCEL